MNLWKWLGRLCSLTPGTKRLALKLFYWWKTRRYQKVYVDNCVPEPHTVVFEAYMGKRYACSPRALYEAMLADPAYDSWTKVWAFRDPEKYRFLEKDPHTRVVAWRTADYYRPVPVPDTGSPIPGCPGSFPAGRIRSIFSAGMERL